MSKGILGGFSSLALQTIMLITLQITSACVLWFLNPLGPSQADAFALFLSVDLLSFAILSYQYRARRWGKGPDASWVALGYFVIVVLLMANLVLY